MAIDIGNIGCHNSLWRYKVYGRVYKMLATNHSSPWLEDCISCQSHELSFLY
jgi:hypothetical protein